MTKSIATAVVLGACAAVGAYAQDQGNAQENQPKMEVKEHVQFLGWNECVELKNGDFRLIVTTDVGPRIIGGFLGASENIFRIDEKQVGKNFGAAEWASYGGHRFWHSPEDKIRPKIPVNKKGDFQQLPCGGSSFIQQTEPVSWISKTVNIYPYGKNSFRIEHILRNDGMWGVELAPWALSVMATGGTAFVPQNQGDKTALLPTKYYTVWPYTSIKDERIDWGDEIIRVQYKAGLQPMKIGLDCKEAWCAYQNKGLVFVKQVKYVDGASYPDNGCNVEIYNCNDFIELETLGPLTKLEPGAQVIHNEVWTLLPAKVPALNSEADAKATIDFSQVPDFRGHEQIVVPYVISPDAAYKIPPVNTYTK